MRVHHSSKDAAVIGTGTSLTSMSSNPPHREDLASSFGSVSVNGPGMPGGGSVRPSSADTTSSTTLSQGFCSRAAHTDRASRPPGRNTRCISAAARCGSRVNCRPCAAQHRVEAAGRLVDVFEVQNRGARDGDLPRWSPSRRRRRRPARRLAAAVGGADPGFDAVVEDRAVHQPCYPRPKGSYSRTQLSSVSPLVVRIPAKGSGPGFSCSPFRFLSRGS